MIERCLCYARVASECGNGARPCLAGPGFDYERSRLLRDCVVSLGSDLAAHRVNSAQSRAQADVRLMDVILAYRTLCYRLVDAAKTHRRQADRIAELSAQVRWLRAQDSHRDKHPNDRDLVLGLIRVRPYTIDRLTAITKISRTDVRKIVQAAKRCRPVTGNGSAERPWRLHPRKKGNLSDDL